MGRSKVRITVIRCMQTQDVFGNDRSEEIAEDFRTRCPLLNEGQSFLILEDGDIPQGFCSWAWSDLHRQLTLLRYGGNYAPMKNGGTIYASCSDGLRPVIFKLERI